MTEYPPIPKHERREYSEASLANMVGDYLRGHIVKGRSVIKVAIPFPHLTFTCVHNECKSEAEGARFKRHGTRPGVTDYIFWWGADSTVDGSSKGHGAIEIKDETGRLSDNQHEFRSRITNHGHNWALCRTVAQVRDVLISWGLDCKNMNCIEPAASFEVRCKLNVDMNKGYKNLPPAKPDGDKFSF